MENINDNETYLEFENNSNDSISVSSIDQSDNSSEEDETDDEKNKYEEFFENQNMWEMYYENNDNINYIGKDELDIDIKQPLFHVEANPLKYFKLFITDELVEEIIINSDIYQQHTLEKLKKENKIKKQSRINKWKKPSKDEFHKYLGIILWMSIHGNSDYTGNII